MGKTTTASMFVAEGFSRLDTDEISRELTLPGGACIPAIREEFGDQFIHTDGGLDRERMAGLVFGDAGERKKLENILHPQIRRVWREQVAATRRSRTESLIVVIPLLFETDVADEFDSVICVACEAVAQLQRLNARGWTDDQVSGRIKAQLPIEDKIRRSDIVLWTSCELDVVKRQVARIADVLRYVGDPPSSAA